METIEPGLRASMPVTRLSHSENRCIIAYYLQSPISTDGARVIWFEFDTPQVDSRTREPMTGRIVVAQPDGSDPQPLETINAPSPSSGAQAQWCGDLPRIAHFLKDDSGALRWQVIDLDTKDRWTGRDAMRHISPCGRKLSIQETNPYGSDATLHVDHTSSYGLFMTYEDGCETFRVAVEDMLAVHPHADAMRPTHLGVKKPLFSPDGRHVSFVLTNQPYKNQTGSDEPRFKDLLVADADGSNLRFVSPFVTHPAWKPDGSAYCALVQDPDDSDQLAYGLFPVDGGVPTYWRHEALRSGHPSIQPGDMAYLVNDQYDRQRGVAQIWLYNVRDWSAQLVVEAEYDDFSNPSGTHMHPAWSPDGASFYFNSAHLGPSQVYRVDL